MNEHEHVWGNLERSRFAGTVHRKCTVDGCRFVKALEDDEQPSETYPPRTIADLPIFGWAWTCDARQVER